MAEPADVLRAAAERIERRARGASRIIRNSDQRPLCGNSRTHDDRWCGDCAGMEDGMNLAAEMLKELADEYDG